METVSLEAIGFPQQLSLFERAAELEGQAPLVVDSTDILRAPEAKLQALCAALGIDWQPDMLAWSAGPKPEDGAWAPHWYDAVWTSTGFAEAPGLLPEVLDLHQAIYEQALAIYETLSQHRL